MEVLLNDIEVLCLAPPYFGFKILAKYFFFSAFVFMFVIVYWQKVDNRGRGVVLAIW